MRASLRIIAGVVCTAGCAAAAWAQTPATVAEQPAAQAGATTVPLIPREVLFGNPDRVRATLSPDGSRIAFLAAKDGVLNVFVGPVDDPEKARPVTAATKRGIMRYLWAPIGTHILYTQDRDGDENWHVYCTDVVSGATTDLTPFETITGPDGQPIKDQGGRPLRPSARIAAVSRSHPTKAMLAVNNRDPRHHDLYRADILEGTVQLVRTCPEGGLEWVVDQDLQPRFVLKMTDDGGQVLLQPGEGDDWSVSDSFPFEDALTSAPLGFTADNSTLYLQDTRGRDTAALYEKDLASGRAKLLAEYSGADLGDVMVHPTTRKVQAASFGRHRPEWRAIDPAVASDVQELGRLGDGVFDVVSRSEDDRTWLVLSRNDDGPNRYYLYRRDRKQDRTRFLFADRAALEKLPLAEMHAVTIPTRDGLELVSYLSLPLAAAPKGVTTPAAPLPTVLLVHGGPWARDEWGCNSLHQLLANRGYAVLSVNFRGSTGFGKSFLNASKMEWGGKMHEDLIDAVRWAVDQKIADPDRIAIFGGSYGGYAALVGLTFTPETFACAVDIVGPSNLVTLMETIPEYWKPGLVMWRTRVGDVTTEEGREFLRSRSPLTFVEKIRRPLLIGHGANDPRVKQSESDQIVAAMQERSIPVTYVLFPDEGHGFGRPENRLAFFAIAESFLARHIGGRYEPLDGVVEKSSAEIKAGAEHVQGGR
jgi:dipeptidyl aminopeptidase/acylaminoacyl peptidase